MKTGFCVCPVCYRETLTEVVGRMGSYWRCMNRNCGRAFLREELPSASCDIDIGTTFTEDNLEARIPTTVAGQIYELRRMFRL